MFTNCQNKHTVKPQIWVHLIRDHLKISRVTEIWMFCSNNSTMSTKDWDHQMSGVLEFLAEIRGFTVLIFFCFEIVVLIYSSTLINCIALDYNFCIRVWLWIIIFCIRVLLWFTKWNSSFPNLSRGKNHVSCPLLITSTGMQKLRLGWYIYYVRN